MKTFNITIDDDCIMNDGENITDWELRKLFISLESELAYRKSVLNGEQDKEMKGEINREMG